MYPSHDRTTGFLFEMLASQELFYWTTKKVSCLFSLYQTLRPFIYTKINSHPDHITTPEPTTTSTLVPSTPAPCPNSLPMWVAAIFGVVGILLGWGITWLFMRRLIKKQKNEDKGNEKETEMKRTTF